MHLDPTVIALGTAIVSLATAITSLVRTMLEKKSSKMTNSQSAFKKNGNRLTHTSVEQWKSNLVLLCVPHHGSIQKKLIA